MSSANPLPSLGEVVEVRVEGTRVWVDGTVTERDEKKGRVRVMIRAWGAAWVDWSSE